MNKKLKKIVLSVLIALFILLILIIIYILFLWKNVPNIFSTNNNENNNVTNQNVNEYVKKNEDLSDISKYSVPTQTEIDSNLKKEYVDKIKELFSTKNINEIFSLMDTNFLYKYNLNKDNFEKYLYDNNLIGDRISIKGLSSGDQENGVSIYRIKYMVNYDIKYVNLIETSSSKFTLDFEQDIIPTIAEHKYTIQNSNITFVIEELKRKENSITYRVNITNNNDYDVQFDLNNISNLALVMSDGNTVKQTDTALSSNTGKITKDSSISKNLFFSVNMQYHNDISGMIFYNVIINNVKTDLQVDFY